MRQIKIPNFVGIIQVQLTNSFFYVGLINTMMLSITLWAAVGPSVQIKMPWVTYWHFAGLGLLVLVLIMVADYVFLYPVRQRFINEQACKHENPAMEELRKHTEDLKLIKDKLGVDDIKTT